MSNIVERLFNQIKEEAKTCEITYCDIYREELIELKIRMGFNVVINNTPIVVNPSHLPNA